MGKPELIEGTKYDGEKARFDLISAEAIWDLSAVLTMGAAKYQDRNWEKGIKWGRIFAAAMRHLWAFWRGEIYDQESGLPHPAHAMWCCMVLTHYVRHGEKYQKFDDRPIYGDRV